MDYANVIRLLPLSEEEAMGLLEIVMLCPVELSTEQQGTAIKLSRFCKSFFHEASSLRLEAEATDESNLIYLHLAA